MEILASLVTQKMKAEKLSLRAAARAIGVSATTVSRIQNNEPIDVQTLLAVCEWLGVQPSYVLDAVDGSNKSLGDKLAALLQMHPRLAEVFSEAIDRINRGEADINLIDDLAAYASFRMNMLKENK